MVVLLLLLLAAHSLAHLALAQPADCPPVPVGPPVDVQIYVDLAGRTKLPVPGPVIGGLGLMQIPAYGSVCPPPPPPSGDVLRGSPAPHDLLTGDNPVDVLRGAPAREVVVGPARPVPSWPQPTPP